MKKIIIILILLLVNVKVFAQCNNPITSFPYVENFETNNGGWIAGGSNSDWAYGTPAKSVITQAASGAKCWITGGLNGNFYNNGENSWLESPCFNFSTLTNPVIAFSVFWETERKYDGASFQYSTDGGTSWQILGSINSNANCDGQNWFNYSPINTFNTAGWSGTVYPNNGSCLGLGGSGSWLTAKHILTALAGRPMVKFRFLFAAGTTCNNFDGFAVDDIVISEAPANSVNFTYSCTANNTVQFTNTSSVCASNFIWNFGDIASANNISNDENPTHQFTNPGQYEISFTATFPGNIIVTTKKTIFVLNVTTSVVQPIQCWGNGNGSLQAIATGGSGNYNYTWNTSPPQNTAIAQNLVAGNYTVTVTATNACSTKATVTLTQPNAITGDITTINDLCKQQNGAATANIIGGVLPYTYSWSNGGNSSSINSLFAQTYYLTVTDFNNCFLSLSAVIKDSFNSIHVNLGNDTSFCPGNTLTLNAGSFANYTWQDNSSAANYVVTKTGNYYVTVKDNDGCTASDSIKIVVDCSDIYFPSGFSPNKDGLNETFGALGNLVAITDFEMNIYNRWGQLIFSTNNAFEKWNGKQKGIDADRGIYIFIAKYSINHQPVKTIKGTVMLIR